ncbi:MAG TPA: hypothetical protein VHY91_20660, partial [Pirellulales bacterium]|nr:hypothetical protein [Pirellulales bacterium]
RVPPSSISLDPIYFGFPASCRLIVIGRASLGRLKMFSGLDHTVPRFAAGHDANLDCGKRLALGAIPDSLAEIRDYAIFRGL